MSKLTIVFISTLVFLIGFGFITKTPGVDGYHCCYCCGYDVHCGAKSNESTQIPPIIEPKPAMNVKSSKVDHVDDGQFPIFTKIGQEEGNNHNDNNATNKAHCCSCCGYDVDC